MASYRSHTTISGAESTDAVFTKPTGLTAGDMMLAFIMTNGVVPDFSLTGWTKIADTDNATNNGIEVLAKVASSGDAAASNFTFTFNGSFGGKNISGILVAYSGTFTSTANITAIDSSFDADADTDDIGEWTGGITPLANSLLVMFVGGACSNASTSSLSGYAIATDNPTWTERADFGNTNNDDTRVGVADASRSQATATGNYECNFNSSGNTDATFGVLLSLSDSASPTMNLGVVTVNINVPSISGTGSATMNLGAVTVNLNLPNLNIQSSAPTWVNLDKNSSTWTNLDKSNG